MMGRKCNTQEQLFSCNVNLSQRVRANHVLRRIHSIIDFDFVYREVEVLYGNNGNVSVPPPVILKLMLLLVLYNVRSERELMDTIPERLDWLWFLGYTLDDEVPNHSVLSKARARWGVDVFRNFFERIVWQCVEKGLVDGSKLFVDSSLVDADASNNSIVNMNSLTRHLNKSYVKLEERLDEISESKTSPANRKYISTTDPEASVIRHSGGKAKLRYKTHRGVDPKNEIITATKVTTGTVDDAEPLEEMIDLHEKNTECEVETVVADSKYGTIENYLKCHDRGIEGHMPSLEQSQVNAGGRNKGIFSWRMFIYDAETDTFTCPAGKTLRKRQFDKRRNSFEYMASSKECAQCELRSQCTRAKTGRTIKRHPRQKELDQMRENVLSKRARRDIRKRQDLSERSFARATRHGYKRARWRNLWRVEIQEFLTAAIQNIMVLIKPESRRPRQANGATDGSFQGIFSYPFDLETIFTLRNVKLVFRHSFCFG